MKKSVFLFMLAFCSLLLHACGGGNSAPPPPPRAITVSLSPDAAQALDASQTVSITATATNDASNRGANWTVTCPAGVNSCGAMAQTKTLSGTQNKYMAPANVSSAEKVTVTATSVSDSTKSASVQVTVNPAFALVNPPPAPPGQGSVGQAMSLNLVSFVQGGTPPFTWAVKSGTLPAGLMLNPIAGMVTGTPSAAATSVVTFSSTDSGSPPVSLSTALQISFTIKPASSLAITSAPPPNGTVGVVYGPSTPEQMKCFWNPYRGWHLVCNPCSSTSRCSSLPPCTGNVYQSPCQETQPESLGFALSATGGSPPYTWSLAPGSALPPGLNLSTGGIITGGPTMPGTYSVTVDLFDSASPPTQASAKYQILIAPPPPPVINAVPLLPIGTLGSPYVGFTFTATSGGPPLTWTETGLPPGMSLSTDGFLSGKPSEAACFPFTIMVQDSFGQSGTPLALILQVLTQGFLPTGSMLMSRASHTATLLTSGQVLVTGGSPAGYVEVTAVAELFDPLKGTFSSTGSMVTARTSHTATLLADGRVLVTGGRDQTDNPSPTAEIFDPAKGSFASTGSMDFPRLYNTATLLSNGKVLVAGGLDTTGAFLASAELFDPGTGTFTPAGNMATARAGHTATLLGDGTVLLAGGDTATAEIYNPGTGTFTPAGNLEAARVNHTATLLKNGQVLVTGGQDNGSNTLASAELFDPTHGAFTPTGNMETVRTNHTAVLLTDGTVLMVGGTDSSTGLSFSSAELFDPTSGSFSPTADMTAARASHTATLLPSGQVLIAGGQGGAPGSNSTLATAELYQ